MAHEAMRVNPCYHLLTYPVRLSRKKLNTLAGLMTGDESVVFMFPDRAARTFLTHVIAVPLSPKDPLCAFNLEEDPVRPIPLRNVGDVGESNVRRFATRARQVLADWLRVHPIVVPRPGPTSIIEMAKSADGIAVCTTEHPPATSTTASSALVCIRGRESFFRGGSASFQPDPLAGSGKVLNPYRKESSRKEREGE
jgi:hypothetical protein